MFSPLVSFITEPIFGNVDFTIYPRMVAIIGQAEKHAHLAVIYLAPTPVVLSAGADTVATGFVIGAFIQEENASFLELMLLGHILLHLSNQQRPPPRGTAHEVMHVLSRNFSLPTNVGKVSLTVHSQQATNVAEAVMARIPRSGTRPLPVIVPKVGQIVAQLADLAEG